MCNCSSFRENCVTHARTHARTHAHGANYNLPPASRAGDKNTDMLMFEGSHDLEEKGQRSNYISQCQP